MKKHNIKKVYFAGKFKISKNKEIPLAERLKNDYRSKLLGSGSVLCCAKDNLKLTDDVIFSGPFYCEQASNGNFTSTDCQVVLNAEFDAVNKCDVYLAVLDESFSVGTIIELGWAIQSQKKIIIFYKEEESNYEIKSDYWFAIADVLKRAKNSKVIMYSDLDKVIETIKTGDIFN